MTINRLIELRQQIQEDLITILEEDLDSYDLDLICDVIVDRINDLMIELTLEQHGNDSATN